MKRNVFALVCSFLLILPTFSWAASGWQGILGAGASWVVDADVTVNGVFDGTAEFNTGYAVGGALGYMIDNYRFEGEMSYMASDMDTYDSTPSDAEINILTFLANGYLDFDTGNPMTPYITAGIGASRIEISEPGYADEDDTVFAYQIGAGLRYALSEMVTLDCRYLYMGSQDMEVSEGNNTAEIEIANHSLILGLRVNF